MLIDAHQHFWRIGDRLGQWPPPELEAIHRDFLPPELEPLLQRAGIDGTILVQSLPSPVDTEFMLDLAEHCPFIRGVVGWVDLKGADACVQIASLASKPKLKGLRPMVQDEASDWLDDPRLDPAVDAMVATGLRLDALVRPRHLPSLIRFAGRHPGLPIVIDHAAKPEIAQGGTPGWRDNMAALAALPNVNVKLSGLLTEAGEHVGIDGIRPYVDLLLTLFGARRTLWGSDWPVLRLAGEYGAWLEMCRELVPVSEQAAVFGGSARAFYGLD